MDLMNESVRCPSCRGAKKVPKLGGIVGECNTCRGKGSILLADKPKPQVIEHLEPASDIIKQVSNVAAVKIERKIDLTESDSVKIDSFTILPEEPQIKLDPKKAIYKRKKG
jgi:RecJ-like exonuclease